MQIDSSSNQKPPPRFSVPYKKPKPSEIALKDDILNLNPPLTTLAELKKLEYTLSKEDI